MAKSKTEMARRQTNALTGDEAEKLFETVDETGHSNEEVARRERSRRKEKGTGVDSDPLSADDPSGSNVGKVSAKTAVLIGSPCGTCARTPARRGARARNPPRGSD